LGRAHQKYSFLKGRRNPSHLTTLMTAVPYVSRLRKLISHDGFPALDEQRLIGVAINLDDFCNGTKATLGKLRLFEIRESDTRQ
jgi:hypothetical protein